MGDAGGRLDDDLEGDGLLSALGGLDCGDQRVDGVDVGGVADLRDHDLVDPVARVLEHFDYVAVPVGRVEPVDTHAQRLSAPVDVVDRLDDVLPRLGLVRGGNGIFKIEVDNVGLRRRHLLEDRRPRPGAEELATVRTGRWLGLDAEGHGCSQVYYVSGKSTVRKLRCTAQVDFAFAERSCLKPARCPCQKPFMKFDEISAQLRNWQEDARRALRLAPEVVAYHRDLLEKTRARASIPCCAAR